MLLTLVLGASLLIHISSTAPAYEGQPARPQVLQYENEMNSMPNSYNFHYNTSDGASRQEQGSILNPGTPNAALDVLGTVRWYDDKGHLYEMYYKAGKRGYRTVIKKIS